MADNGTTSINFKLWTPTGVEVLFHLIPTEIGLALPTNGPDAVIFGQQTAALLASLLNGGWLAQRPELDTGEDVFTVDAVVRSTKVEDDGRETPIIAFYPVNFNFPALKKYLNTPDDAAAFERVSGLKLANLPSYIGRDSIDRNAASKEQAKHVIAARPFKVVYKLNPDYQEGQQKPKRWFVRYADDAPAAPPTSPPPAENSDQQIPDWWKAATHNTDLFAAFGDQRGNVLRDLLVSGKVTMTTPIEDVVKTALATNTDEVPF